MAIARRARELRRARGTGRTLTQPGRRTTSIIAPAGGAPPRQDENDHLTNVRVDLPYRRLQEENPGAGITR